MPSQYDGKTSPAQGSIERAGSGGAGGMRSVEAEADRDHRREPVEESSSKREWRRGRVWLRRDPGTGPPLVLDLLTERFLDQGRRSTRRDRVSICWINVGYVGDIRDKLLIDAVGDELMSSSER